MGPQLVKLILFLQEHFYASSQLSAVDGFDQEIIGTQFDSGDLAIHVIQTGNDDDRDVFGDIHRFQALANLEAVYIRQKNIQQYQVHVIGLNTGNRILSTFGDIQTQGFLFEHFANDARIDLIVFNK